MTDNHHPASPFLIQCCTAEGRGTAPFRKWMDKGGKRQERGHHAGFQRSVSWVIYRPDVLCITQPIASWLNGPRSTVTVATRKHHSSASNFLGQPTDSRRKAKSFFLYCGCHGLSATLSRRQTGWTCLHVTAQLRHVPKSPYETDSRLLLTATFKITWHRNWDKIKKSGPDKL